MLKYVPEETQVTFSEIPEEITLCINISNCPIRCKDCHSKHLWKDIGEPLNTEVLDKLISNNTGISCIVFMGGDSDIMEINNLAKYIKKNTSLKVGWYTGKPCISRGIDAYNFDYIKTGPYIESKGPLTSKTTNQRMYKICVKSTVLLSKVLDIEDITYKFWEISKNA